jgi:hypothetical protein
VNIRYTDARFRSGIYPTIVILTLSEAEGEESLYFARSTIDTTGKMQGSVRSAQDDGHF